jgi:hypothetical protein
MRLNASEDVLFNTGWRASSLRISIIKVRVVGPADRTSVQFIEC